MQNCSCIRGRQGFFFLLEDISCSKVLYTDFSDWMQDLNYVVPNQYTIQVGLLDKDQLQDVVIDTSKANDVSEVFCKDGIYKVVAQVCENKYSHYVGNLPKLKCCLDTYMASADYNPEKATEINRLIQLISTNAAGGRVSEAKNYYKEAQRALERLNCDCNLK